MLPFGDYLDEVNYWLKVKPGLGMVAVTPEGKLSGQACNAYSPTVKPLVLIVGWVFYGKPQTSQLNVIA